MVADRVWLHVPAGLEVVHRAHQVLHGLHALVTGAEEQVGSVRHQATAVVGTLARAEPIGVHDDGHQAARRPSHGYRVWVVGRGRDVAVASAGGGSVLHDDRGEWTVSRRLHDRREDTFIVGGAEGDPLSDDVRPGRACREVDRGLGLGRREKRQRPVVRVQVANERL